MNEFELIEKYLLPLSKGRAEAAGFRNDAAVLCVPEGCELVVTSDSAVAGVHFLDEQSPESIAKKVLRRNLSDLNAMGAKPYCYQMCLMLPDVDADWIEKFVSGLADDQKQFGIFLSGGDVSSSPGPLTISITAMGVVEKGQALTRSGAKPGDLVVLSGPVGDAVCGLKLLKTNKASLCFEREGNDVPALIAHYFVPDIPAPFSALPGVHAAIDISDGLVQDLGHVCQASGVAAEIDVEKMRFSAAVQGWLDQGLITYEDLLTGGDDYQLLLAAEPDALARLKSQLPDLQVIGEFKAGTPDVRVMKNGQAFAFQKKGWQHF